MKQIPKQKRIGEKVKTRKIFINNKIQLCAEKVRFKMTEQHKSKRLCSCSAVWHTEHVTSTACKRNKTFTTHQANKLSIANHKKCPSISPYRIIMLLFIGFPGLNTGKLSCFFLLIVFLLLTEFTPLSVKQPSPFQVISPNTTTIIIIIARNKQNSLLLPFSSMFINFITVYKCFSFSYNNELSGELCNAIIVNPMALSRFH